MKKIFQFLLVRLKAIWKRIYRRICKISIPFGAIKRSFVMAEMNRSTIFQFLLVRLKEANR